MTIPDQHASAEVTQPFQRIEVEETASPAAPSSSTATGSGSRAGMGFVAWVRDEVAQLPRPDRERQPCAAEWREYSRRGVWTTEAAGTDESTGPQRTAHAAYTRIFAVPVIVACDYVKYVVARPERFGAAMLVVALFVVGLFLLLFL